MEGDHVYIQLNSSNHNLHFEIRNPVLVDFNTHEVSLFFKRLHYKPDKASHGYGLYYLANKIKNMMEASVPNVYHLKGKIGFYFTLMYSLTLNTPHFVGRYFIQIYYS